MPSSVDVAARYSDGTLTLVNGTTLLMDLGVPANAGAPVALEPVMDGRAVLRFLAQDHRTDLEAAGCGEGQCGFRVGLPESLGAGRSHLLTGWRVADGAALPGAPVLLPAQSRGRVGKGKTAGGG